MTNNKKEIAYFMTRLYQKGLTSCSGGNISIIDNNKNVFITPSQKDKGKLMPEDIGEIDLNGNNYTPEIKLSMETDMHLAIYKKRPDVKAIIHAHPIYATSYAIKGKTINTKITDETHIILGNITSAPYALSGSKELATNLAKNIGNSNVVIMEKHGILSVGKTLFEAYNRIEVLEAAAKMNFIIDKI